MDFGTSIVSGAVIASITFILKDTLNNLFAGIKLKLSEREVNEGDEIMVYTWPTVPLQNGSEGDKEGATVKKVFWRRTVLEYQGDEILIQNLKLIENPVRILSSSQ